jgi:hypothetical protein
MKIASVIACVPLLAGTLFAQAKSDRLPGEGGQGVTVKLLPPSPQTHEPLRFVLSEPAYVAAFIVYPGAGVRLLYPTVDVPERLRAGGYNTDQLIGAGFDGDAYNVVLGPRLPGPSYLYVIASRHPLDVARYVHKPMTLASAVGVQASRSFYNDVAFDALLNNAIALGDDTSWDSDVYMLWSNDGSSGRLADATTPGQSQASLYTYVLCTDGTTRYVPINYPFAGCPGQSHIRPTIAATRQVQQSASTQQQGAASTQLATVLPTIVGPRPSPAERRAAIRQEGASQRAMYTTVANGDQQTGEQQNASASATELQVIAVRPRNARPDRDALHGQYSPEQREAYIEQARTRQMNGQVVGGSPQLPPNPRLAPNPGLAPAPGLNQNANQNANQRETARPPERPRRDFNADRPRPEHGDAPRETPRSEAPRPAPPPRMTPPPAEPGASQGTSADNSSKGSPRIQP